MELEGAHGQNHKKENGVIDKIKGHPERTCHLEKNKRKHDDEEDSMVTTDIKKRAALTLMMLAARKATIKHIGDNAQGKKKEGNPGNTCKEKDNRDRQKKT
jgi:hypothetical protein